jgi:hypothetical protein
MQGLPNTAPGADEEGIAVADAHPPGVTFETFSEQALSAAGTTRV